MRARRATVRDGRRRALRRRAATVSPKGPRSGCQPREIFSQQRKVPAAPPFLVLSGDPHPVGTEGVVQHEGSDPNGAVGVAAFALPPGRAIRSPPAEVATGRSTDLPMGCQGGGPLPGPAFGTSFVFPPVSGAGPAAAPRNICGDDRTEQTENIEPENREVPPIRPDEGDGQVSRMRRGEGQCGGNRCCGLLGTGWRHLVPSSDSGSVSLVGAATELWTGRKPPRTRLTPERRAFGHRAHRWAT
jgi:hypothetical protein